MNSKSAPAFGGQKRTLNVVIENPDASGPQDHGSARIRLTRNGRARWAIRLADNTRRTRAVTASPDGDIPVYAPLRYPGGGVFYALLPTETVGDLIRIADEPRPNGRWIKHATPDSNRRDRMYRDGFDLDLDIYSAEHQ